MEKRCDDDVERYDDNSNLKLISLECGSKGLGIRLSKSSWDPYPFISQVDAESKAEERGLLVGDCILKVFQQPFFKNRVKQNAKHFQG
jgi:C-terminal processing protease CtpA/Prc